MANQYRLTCDSDMRERYFTIWKNAYETLFPAHFLNRDLHERLFQNAYILMGFFQNDITLSEEQYREFIKSVLVFCDIPGGVFEPLEHDGLRTARMIRQYLVKE